MAYIWINPVTAAMYEPEELEKFLRKHGYKIYVSHTDWAGTVKEKYRKMATQVLQTVIDVRCPRIKELVYESGLAEKGQVVVPDIHPILIHYGQEASFRMEQEQEEIIVTTPCQTLADMGNGLKLPYTRFVTWKDFLLELGDEPERQELSVSPIPPGFFDTLKMKTASVSGEEEIREYLNRF